MEKFESQNLLEEEEKIESEIPLVNASLKRCEKIENSKEVLEKVKLLLEEYLKEEIQNTEIFSSEKHGASFAYTVVKLRDIAKILYKKLNLPTPLDTKEETPEEKTSKKEIIFGTSFSVDVGHPYHWMEHGIDQIAKKLPEAFRKISQGEQPEDLEIYGVGSPSGELGTVSPEFIESAGKKPFEKTGELYAEFVHSLSSKTPSKEKKEIIDLWGVSMGASMASTTATSLLEKGQATQSEKDSYEKPLVRTIMYMPVGTIEAKRKKWQIPLGFGLEALYSMATNSYAKEFFGQKQKDFSLKTNEILAQKGIHPHLSNEDIQNKKKLIWNSLNQLCEGVPVSKEIKTNEIIGIYDPLMYPVSPESEENHRKFGIKMTHTPAIVRENYFKRLVKTAKMMGTTLKNT